MSLRQESGDTLLMKGFGDRLRLLRQAYVEKHGVQFHTKAQWAKRLWVSPAMYGRWESGENLPKFVDLLRISLLFRVDPNYLVAGVLSEHLERWLYAELKLRNPGLLDEEDYWQRQSELYAQASRSLEALEDKKSPQSTKDAKTQPTSDASPSRKNEASVSRLRGPNRKRRS
jgi:transcriptional regulator with XRE-family HTH domain